MEKPNILVVLTDQQSYNMLSCAGNPWVSTPHLDELAAEGVRFTNVHCTNPVCCPSRFSLMTGLYPSDVGFPSNAYEKEMPGPLPGYILENGLGTLLRQQGYQTYYGGKEHLPKMRAADLGFTYFCADERDQLAEESARLVREMDLHQPFCMVASFINPHDICLMAIRDFARQSDNAEDRMIADGGHVEIGEVEKAEEMARQWPPQEFFERLCPPLPENYGVAPDEPEAIRFMQEQRGFKKLARAQYTDEQWRMHRWVYARLTEQVDRQIGMLLQAVRDRGIWDNTVVIFTSDHGDMDAAHKMEHKTALYQEAVRVPMLVKDTECHTGICDALVCNGLDLVPTLLDYAGAQTPAYLEGKSFRSCMEAPDAPFREHLLVESELGRMVAMRDGCYQCYSEGARGEQFFDRASNPGQMFNQLADPQYAARVEQARAFLQNRRQK